ncbi:hypothetical protein FHR32_008620 [Streptosporangium album]|uniref:Uncharacterized protein n=1 Tax=Streptosporangium album TaxID=47479 RepID=A0A7W7WE00_9ACTN|nr:hypothetical protein [Streptosporangium album]MBB4944217.1 hypothetical protein [Streptosporangium album]
MATGELIEAIAMTEPDASLSDGRDRRRYGRQMPRRRPVEWSTDRMLDRKGLPEEPKPGCVSDVPWPISPG